MNKIITKISLASAFFLVSTSAYASDGTITFSGAITDTTCAVKINNTGATGTVNLPSVPKTLLNTNGAVAGATAFALNLSGCTTGKSVNAYFEAGPTVDSVTGNLINGGSAGNVQVQVLNASSTPIAIGAAGQALNPSIVTSSSVTGGNLNYVAQYYATGTSTSGTVNTSVTYSITYN